MENNLDYPLLLILYTCLKMSFLKKTKIQFVGVKDSRIKCKKPIKF